MRKLYITLIMSVLLPFANAYAQTDDLFDIDDDDALSAAKADAKQEQQPENSAFLSSFLSNRLPAATVRNINKAEKVFCYTVDYAPADYEGYLINDLALTGSCGELSAEGKDVIKQFLFNNNSLFSNNMDKCNISPKIMLRYIHGVDYTDVLISSPCQSLTFFHGNNVTTVNAAPGAAVIDQLISAYSSLKEKFVSPALLGQMVANGQVMNQGQKEIVRRMSPTETPAKKWGNNNNQPQNPTPETQGTPKQPAKSGWNRLK